MHITMRNETFFSFKVYSMVLINQNIEKLLEFICRGMFQYIFYCLIDYMSSMIVYFILCDPAWQNKAKIAI